MKLTAFLVLVASCAALAASEESINKSFSMAPGGSVVLDVEIGAIVLNTKGDSDQVTVDAWRKVSRKNKAEEEKYLQENPVQITQEGNTVTVRCRNKDKSFTFSGWRNSTEGKYTILVPAKFNAKLKSSDGAISVSDLTGEVDVDTSDGELKFSHVTGPLHGHTSDGSIRITDCDGTIKVDTSDGGIEVNGGKGSFNGHTSDGGVTVKNFNGPVDGKTSDGPINAELISPLAGDVTLATSDGGVTVKIPGNAGFDLDAKTSDGSVHCELPITTQGKTKEEELKGTVNGGGPKLHLETSDGNVHIKKI